MKSHPYAASGERQVMKIEKRYLEFPTEELQEHTKPLSHIKLVLSQFPKEVLHVLKESVTQEIQLCKISMSMELTKVVADNDAL
jgi:hypothetical protein